MKNDAWVAETQFARSLLVAGAPKLVAVLKEKSRAWLSGTMVKKGAHVYIVAQLASPGDLEFTPGIQQLYGIDWLDPNIIFTLPNDVAVEFFKAHSRSAGYCQRDVISWPSLPDALAKLEKDAIFCFVPAFCVLTPRYFKILLDVITRKSDGGRDRLGAGVLRASFWRKQGTNRCADQGQALAWSVLDTLKRQPADAVERRCATILEKFSAAVTAAKPPIMPADPQPTSVAFTAEGSVLCGPGIRDAKGELVLLSAAPNSKEILIRQAVVLGKEGGPFHFDPPLQCVGQQAEHVQLLLPASPAEVRCIEFSLKVPPSRLTPWMVTCYLNRGGAGNEMIRAFAQGIGCSLRYAEDETGPRPGVPVVWGVLRGSDRVLAWAKKSGQYFFYVDHAYFERGHGRNYRITRNGYGAGRVRKCPPDRFAALGIEIGPWRRNGSDILVCPPTDNFMAAHDCADWLDTTLAFLRCKTDRKLVVRRKPQSGQTMEPLKQALMRAHALVAHSSNVAVEAAVAGIPVFVSSVSAAAPVGLTDLAKIETPIYPDREAWLAHLAYNQFSFDEIRSGEAWRMLLEWEEREFANEGR